jgi:hypothetical protein
VKIDKYLGASVAASLTLCALAMPSTGRADTDACTLLTAAEVGEVAGAAVADGTHVSAAYVKTCTWNPSGGSSVKAVTLYLQTAAAYDGGKQLANQMAAAAKGAVVQPASVGLGDQAGLLVKKGSNSFKVAVYATLPVDKKEAMELALAKQVLTKL